MIASYANNREAGPGNGVLRLAQSELEPGPLNLAIQRSSDHAFLAAGAEWKSQKSFLDLEARQDGADLAVFLGPDLTAQLSTTETYRVILRDAQGSENRAILRIAEIIYSPAAKADNAPAAPEDAENPPAAASLTPGPPGQPAETAEIATLPPLAAAAPEKPGEEARNSMKKGRGSAFWLMLGAIALGCSLLAIYLHLFRHGQMPAAEKPASQAASPEAGNEAEDMVRRFFAQGSPGGGNGAMTLARQIPAASPDEQDALYRLYYYAAGQGNPDGLLSYAQALDPSRPGWGSIHKDAGTAWESYAAALAGGRGDEAGDAMRHMRAWLEKEAANGSADAARWLAGLREKQRSGQP